LPSAAQLTTAINDPTLLDNRTDVGRQAGRLPIEVDVAGRRALEQPQNGDHVAGRLPSGLGGCLVDAAARRQDRYADRGPFPTGEVASIVFYGQRASGLRVSSRQLSVDPIEQVTGRPERRSTHSPGPAHLQVRHDEVNEQALSARHPRSLLAVRRMPLDGPRRSPHLRGSDDDTPYWRHPP
jgi:hypothetical protein